ncbi:MAG: ABC-F family ATP-binding cassette domain-containing protein [Bacteroidetes bacterium]|nr:ABC-F family ATP-binding cassette domain-containing protein [Bacteroidota bacterium]HNR20666.1 ABC-F family ATP-binding cassette domain-containing protein [Bacteroidia bacterium]HNU33049.1 ABC-F family ATP-binding cassette domain-containing protein [Bacteroidia bacterium]
MNVLSAEGLSKSFHETPLFTNLTIGLSANQKCALIAANGTGKTTLMKILAGTETPESGTVTVRSGYTVGYLSQQPEFNEELSVLDGLFKDENEVLKVIGDYEKAVALHADASVLQNLIEKIDALNGWTFEARVREVLGRLGIHDFDKKIKYLSGGQKKRLMLSKLLIEDPDILLLDEPTNHLDIEMIEWLENYLNGLNKAILIISHDRYFIDGVCSSIIELDNQKLFEYKGNYAYYLEKKTLREQVSESEIDKARNLYRRELEWMRKQPKARGTKQKAREDSFYETEKVAKQKKGDDKLNITLQMNRLGSKILEFEYISKAYNDKVLLKDFAYTFKRGERIGIVGKNGVGKTTLLNLVMGLDKPDAGKIKAGQTVVFGYFSQEKMILEEDKRVIDIVRDITDYVDLGGGNYMNVAQFLTKWNFPGSKQHTYVSKLSGGERSRLHLLTVLLKNPNFLILDEPTNDLDIVTLNTLEDFLMSYEGCMLLVTHDRYFMDKLVDHILVFEGDGKIKDINGNYTDYREQKEEEKKEAVKEKKEITDNSFSKNNQPKNKLTFKEKMEFETLEKEIEKLEAKKTELLTDMNSGNIAHDKLNAVSNEYLQVCNTIEEKTIRWLELSEFAR